MDKLNKIKPVYLYFIGGGFFLISQSFKDEYKELYYFFMIVGLGFVIYSLINHFKN